MKVACLHAHQVLHLGSTQCQGPAASCMKSVRSAKHVTYLCTPYVYHGSMSQVSQDARLDQGLSNFDTVSVNVRRRVDSNSHDAASTSYWTFTLSLFSLSATYTSYPPMASCAPSTQPHPEDVYMHEIDNNAIPSPSSGLPWVFTERAIRAQNAVRDFLRRLHVRA